MLEIITLPIIFVFIVAVTQQATAAALIALVLIWILYRENHHYITVIRPLRKQRHANRIANEKLKDLGQ